MLEALILIAALVVADSAATEHYLVDCDVHRVGPQYSGPEWTPLTPEEADRFEPGADLVRRCAPPVRVPGPPSGT